MNKKLFRVLALLMLLCVTVQAFPLSAAAAVDVGKSCSLELEYSSKGVGFPGLEIKVYRVAEFYSGGDYALVSPYSALPVKIHGITSQKEWRDAASTLAAYIASEQIPATAAQLTDAYGKARFTGLQTGIYLVMGTSAKTDTEIYRFEDVCIFLPRPQEDGTQVYDLAAKPKSTVTPIPDEEEEVEYQVVKLWKDAGYRNQRPVSVTVNILRNGSLYQTVTLSAENNWSHSWKAPDDGSVWSVVEKNVPYPYTVVITVSGHTFNITNTRPSPGVTPPQTGDTFALDFWLTVMSVSGVVLMALGMLQKRSRR